MVHDIDYDRGFVEIRLKGHYRTFYTSRDAIEPLKKSKSK